MAICNGILCGLVAGSLAWLLYADTAQGMKLGFVMFLAMMLNILLALSWVWRFRCFSRRSDAIRRWADRCFLPS